MVGLLLEAGAAPDVKALVTARVASNSPEQKWARMMREVLDDEPIPTIGSPDQGAIEYDEAEALVN